jgi:Predicted membrane protein
MLIAYNKFMKYIFLFITGGFAYGMVENISRGFSHISMFIAGGICFILIGLLNEIFPWQMSLISQMVISSFIVTVVEFVTGLVVNVWLKLNIWDYSSLPYNIMGQVCLLFTNIWFFLSLFAILLDDYLRYFMLKEEKPHYKIL